MALADTMQALLDCAADALDAENRKPALVFLQPGEEVAWDNCCEDGGQLWVRANPIVPGETQGNCGVALLRASLSVGVLRCVRALQDDGNPPSASMMTQDALGIIRDMEIVLEAIQCCFKDDRNIKVGAWTAFGPQGGCAGGEWSVTVSYPGPCGCEDGG